MKSAGGGVLNLLFQKHKCHLFYSKPEPTYVREAPTIFTNNKHHKEESKEKENKKTHIQMQQLVFID